MAAFATHPDPAASEDQMPTWFAITIPQSLLGRNKDGHFEFVGE